MTNLKKRLTAGETLHGCWLSMGSNIAAEIIGTAGFDWVIIDLEHGAGTEDGLLNQLQALNKSDTVPLVRVESHDRTRVKKALDAGACGIMFPQIRTSLEAAEAIAGMYYPPKGVRGLAKVVRASQYGAGFDAYYEFAKNNLLGIIQVETREALNHIDEIAALEGVDILFVGPSDLSLSLGVFGRWDHALYKDAVAAVGEAARKSGKAAGVLIFDPGQYDYYYKNGFRFIASGSDMAFLNQASKATAKLLRNKEAENKNRNK